MNESTGRVPCLRARPAGTAPDQGDVERRFPSDAFPLSCSDARFAICPRDIGKSDQEDFEDGVCRWKQMFSEFSAGEIPVRFRIGGFGRPRCLGMFPRPVPWAVWFELQNMHRTKCGAPFAKLDARVDGRRQAVERSKPPSPGGAMFIFASS